MTFYRLSVACSADDDDDDEAFIFISSLSFPLSRLLCLSVGPTGVACVQTCCPETRRRTLGLRSYAL